MDSNPNSRKKFFRGEGEIGDVISQAKNLLAESEGLSLDLQKLSETTVEFATLVEEAKYKIGIRERLGQNVDAFKKKIGDLTATWKETRKAELTKKEAEILERADALERERADFEGRMEGVEEEQRQKLSSELESLRVVQEQVQSELGELSATKATIEDILSESEDEVRDKTLSVEEVEFLKVNYFNLVHSRIKQGLKSPITGEHHYGNWEMKEGDGRLSATIKTGVKRRVAIRFDLRFIPSEDVDGFIYKKIGLDSLEEITGYLADKKDKDAYHALILVSPTGWTNGVSQRAAALFDNQTSVYLVDLMGRTITFNNGDKKTAEMQEWFSPVSLEEEVNEVKARLQKEAAEERTSQFRADKVVSQYGVPRKIVVATFKAMEKEGSGSIIDRSEGAKDLIFLVGGE